MALKKFLPQQGLPQTESDIINTLKSGEIREIRNFVLGPGMISNIPQACQRWLKRTGLETKGTFYFGETPKKYLLAAQEVREPGVVPLFWTCAVYGEEKDLFFDGGTRTFMFFVREVMPLDHMQLACAGELSDIEKINLCSQELLPCRFKILTSHKSPEPLLRGILQNNPHCQWQEATSNGAAAITCRNGEVDLCITTESARKEQGLNLIHSFGSPDMVFFGGLTEHGAIVVRQAYSQISLILC